MGNIHASESGPPPPAPEADVINPGTVEDLHKKCKDIFPMYFEGCKVMVNKGLSNNFQVSHTLNMSQAVPSGYRFGATYVGSANVLSPQESYPVLIGDIDMSGNLQANIIHAPTEKLRCKMTTMIQQSKWQAAQFTGDYKGSDYTASLTLGNPDLISGSGVMVAHYFQNITSKLAMGAELAYQVSPQIPGGHIGVLSAAGRYSGADYSLSTTIGNAGSVHACYYQKCSDELQVGAEIETNIRMQESKATVGYQLDLPRAGLSFRGAVNSNWEVTAVMEKKLLPIPFTLALCGMMNHPKNQFQMGVGLFVG